MTLNQIAPGIFRGPTVSDQIRKIESASPGHLRARVKELKLRGDGTRSWVIIKNDSRFWNGAQVPLSDSIAIYDADGAGSRAKLHRAFIFQPDLDGDKMPWRFIRGKTIDLDGDGNREVVGAFTSRTRAHPATVPAFIRWDPVRTRYTIRALIENRPKLISAKRSDGASVWQAIGTHRSRLADPAARAEFRGYGAQAFDVVPATSAIESPVVVAAYPLRSKFKPAAWQLAVFGIDIEYDGKYARQCLYPTRAVVIGPLIPAGITDPRILRAYKRSPLSC